MIINSSSSDMQYIIPASQLAHLFSLHDTDQIHITEFLNSFSTPNLIEGVTFLCLFVEGFYFFT